MGSRLPLVELVEVTPGLFPVPLYSATRIVLVNMNPEYWFDMGDSDASTRNTGWVTAHRATFNRPKNKSHVVVFF